ncbi:hypothetical protein EYF80_010990 [Liparis tanakae]|uniref:Uncharacterized protein n=1 Tax=Liparis tanakae TaxID=230148 RepID=A0A4Z2IL92_9TELE|nr:hypothetical protein EYF80_010990 [Liparis tanakae]
MLVSARPPGPGAPPLSAYLSSRPQRAVCFRVTDRSKRTSSRENTAVRREENLLEPSGTFSSTHGGGASRSERSMQ